MPAERDARGRFVGTRPKRRPGKAARPSAPAAGLAERRDPVARAGPSEPFLSELQASWIRHGAETIETVRTDRPHDYLRLMASNLAKDVGEEGDPIDAMSDDEVAEELRRVLDRLGAVGAGAGPRAGAAEEA